MNISVGDCQLHCFEKANTYMLVGTVDDGTHCNRDSGVCILGVCHKMPKYSPPTEAPPTDASGKDMVPESDTTHPSRTLRHVT